MTESRDVWCIKDDMTGKYLRGFSEGGIPMMGATRKEAMEFDSESAVLEAYGRLPITILASPVRRKSRRPQGG